TAARGSITNNTRRVGAAGSWLEFIGSLLVTTVDGGPPAITSVRKLITDPRSRPRAGEPGGGKGLGSSVRPGIRTRRSPPIVPDGHLVYNPHHANARQRLPELKHFPPSTGSDPHGRG